MALRSIVAVAYKKETNPINRTSAKHAANQILAAVNAALNNQGLGSLTVAALEKKLRPIINGA